METTYVIGDIHGCYDRLVALMDKINIDLDSESLVFLGDYIDRGPDSFEVVEYLVNLKKKCPDIVFIKGNHEEMLEKYISETDRFTYLINGGQQTLESYGKHRKPTDTSLIPDAHLEFFNSLVLYYETDHYIFVHAGLRKDVPLEKQKPEDLLWIRKNFIQSNYDFGKQVVFGHTPLPEPLLQPNKIGIDTGAVYGNKLTCVRLPDLVFYSA
jgi:serine/threonine protein phosphatase 1